MSGVRARMASPRARLAPTEARTRSQRKAEERARRTRRQAVFARVQRLSAGEASYLDPNFDPGPGYDLA